MRLLCVFALAISCVAVSAQECPSAELAIAIDLSENSMRAASSNREDPETEYDILEEQLRMFLEAIADRAGGLRLSVIGFTSSQTITIAARNSTVATVLANVGNIGQITEAGSWTYVPLQNFTTAPSIENNKLIVISTQGSGVDNRRVLADTEAKRVRELGWDIEVIAVQGGNAIDFQELTSVNNGVQPVPIVDPNPVDSNDPKGYKKLSPALVSIVNKLCGFSGGSGVCDECLYDAGYSFAFDTMYCDDFWRCMKDREPVRMHCSEGTFWDGQTCNYINRVNCSLAQCNAATPEGTRYPSGRCCNIYFQCQTGGLVQHSCEAGQVFNAATMACEVPANMTLVCEGIGKFQCGVDLQNKIGGETSCDSKGYSADPTGDPCLYKYGGYTYQVPQGTIFDFDACILNHDTEKVCAASRTQDRNSIFDNGTCSSTFLVTYDGGSKTVISERLGTELPIYTMSQGVTLDNDALVFPAESVDPYYYFFYFNNRDVPNPSAYRVVFKLGDFQQNTEYDILSNGFCSSCPYTISFSVMATSASERVVTVRFITTVGIEVITSAVINKQNVADYLELIVILDSAQVHGQLNALRPDGEVRQSVDLDPAEKPVGASLALNKCGIQLGRGENTKFVGMIGEFAVHENCRDISAVLN